MTKLWGKIQLKKEHKRKLFDFLEIGSSYTSSDSEKRRDKKLKDKDVR